MKTILFFIIALLSLTYLITFWQNWDRKIKFHMLGKDIEISLGLLSFGIFFDGAIIAVILVWLLYN